MLSLLGRWMYWTDWGVTPGRIERAGMDGSHREILVNTSLKWPNGLTLDMVQRRIFWVDAKLNSISSCNFDGTSRRLILQSPSVLAHPFSITTFEDYVYWTDWTNETIFKANKFTGKEVTPLLPPNTVSCASIDIETKWEREQHNLVFELLAISMQHSFESSILHNPLIPMPISMQITRVRRAKNVCKRLMKKY